MIERHWLDNRGRSTDLSVTGFGSREDRDSAQQGGQNERQQRTMGTAVSSHAASASPARLPEAQMSFIDDP
jgi:hypothetical protein